MIHPQPKPETVTLVRRRYSEGAIIRDIEAETGLPTGTIYKCLDGFYPDETGTRPPPIPRRQRGVQVRHSKGSRAALVARMWRTAERQVQEVEERLKLAGLKLDERESNARTLAVVARTLRELSTVDQANRRNRKSGHDDNGDRPPRDIEELRRQLAEKLEKIIAGDGEENPGAAD
jgi:hypothetical protein